MERGDGDYLFSLEGNPQRWRATGRRLGRNYTREFILDSLSMPRPAPPEVQAAVRRNVMEWCVRETVVGAVADAARGEAIADVALALKVQDDFGIGSLAEYDDAISALSPDPSRREEVELLCRARSVAARGDFFLGVTRAAAAEPGRSAPAHPATIDRREEARQVQPARARAEERRQGRSRRQEERMRAMIEIEWVDGRVTRIPELALGDAFGESAQAEVDVRFDGLSEGLVAEARHHEPDGEAGGDLRGRGCAVYADCFYSLIEPGDLRRVQCVLYEGVPRICRIGRELVNLSRASALCSSVVGERTGLALEMIAACARYLKGASWESDAAARDAVAAELGVPRTAVDDAAAGRCGVGASGQWEAHAAPDLGDYS